jgi:hypothetical protein
MEKVNFKKVALIAVAILTAVSLVTGQAAEFVKKALAFFFSA